MPYYSQYEQFLRIHAGFRNMDGNNPIECAHFDQLWEKQTRLEYESAVNQKKLEIQNLTK